MVNTRNSFCVHFIANPSVAGEPVASRPKSEIADTKHTTSGFDAQALARKGLRNLEPSFGRIPKSFNHEIEVKNYVSENQIPT